MKEKGKFFSDDLGTHLVITDQNSFVTICGHRIDPAESKKKLSDQFQLVSCEFCAKVVHVCRGKHTDHLAITGKPEISPSFKMVESA